MQCIILRIFTNELSENVMGHTRVTKDVFEIDIQQTEKKNAALSWDS